MLTTNTNFDVKHALDYKTPAYLIQFYGEDIYYYDHIWPGTGGVAEREDVDEGLLLEDEGAFILEGDQYKRYLDKISGLSQQITPEEGKSTIGGLMFQLLDYNNEITALLATDTYYFHRKMVTVKAGYGGMTESDMLTIMVGWITGLKMDGKLLLYEFNATDPQKWMQRKIFRDSETTPVTISGNPIDILLRCLTSTGAGTNGDYDVYAAVNGLALDEDYIDVTGIEGVRDDWFPGDSHYMRFTINERIKAKDFFETEIFKVLNIYPVIDGQGRFTIKPFKPPITALETVQSFTADNIIGLPQLDFNLSALVNEVEIHYDWDSDDEEFDSIAFYVDSTSLNNRGPGKAPITIKTKGLHTSHSPASIAGRATEVLTTRKNRIFGRFATPPIKLKLKTFFSQWITEVGDVVPFTHSKVPDITAGTRGLTETRMEVISKNVNWRQGNVSIELLNTGFAKGTYQAISPTMTVVSAVDGENFTVSVADAAKYANLTLPEIQLCDLAMRQKVASKTLLTVNTTTGACTCDDLGVTPTAGDIVLFSDYRFATTEQKLWGYIADDNDNLGIAILAFDSHTGSYTVGNTLIGASSGHTATIDRVVNYTSTTGELELSSATGTFQDNEIIYEASYEGELITDGDCSSDSFNDDGDGVAYDGVGEEYDWDGTEADSVIYQNPPLTVSSFYKLVFTVQNYVSGRVKIYAGGGSYGSERTSDGTYTEYLQCSGDTVVYVQGTQYLGSNFEGSVDDISVKKITNAALANGTLATASNDDAHLIIP